MNGQAERCDRTAYVSGLQPTISDIELFELFNRVAHVEKVIVRNGTARHALVVFKTVQGLYQVLVHFQGTTLHGRQLHIRPLRESSHANNETISTMFEQARHQGNGQSRRPASAQECFTPSAAPFVPVQHDENRIDGRGGYRNTAEPYNRRRYGYNRTPFSNESFSGMQMFGNCAVPQYSGFRTENFQFENYKEGAKRFDNLANVIRANTPTDPFGNEAKQRAGSARESAIQKQAPPTWKMELQIKKNEENEATTDQWKKKDQATARPMTAQQLIDQVAQAEQSTDQMAKKKRPNLSVINPSLFYEQYPRTSSPFLPISQNHNENSSSPHDPAVLAYRRMRAPQSAFDGLSPIDTNNCSFITKHLGPMNDPSTLTRRDLTNDELSEMIVSTGNLRNNQSLINPIDNSIVDSPAPWSPVKRLRAESGCIPNAAQVASPQFSPIKPKSMEFFETEDDVFLSENKGLGDSRVLKQQPTKSNVSVESKIQNYEDINNSRLPSNSHSANPRSDKKAFVFPDYPLCRHASVPSIAHLVGDLSDFCTLSPHVTVGDGEKLFMEKASPRVFGNSSDTENKEALLDN